MAKDRNIYRGKYTTIICNDCKKEILKRNSEIKNSKEHRCKSCSSRKNILKLNEHHDGDNNPNWKGGHEGWKQGRFGGDKNGLSWKKQRQLAWERDNYTCQNCELKNDKRKPDVHHIIPFRFSFSHALENLICLCSSCHHKEEAKIKELWGGHTLNPPHKIKKEKVKCAKCNNEYKIKSDGLCKKCYLIEIIIPRVKELRNQGLSYPQISKQLNIGVGTAWAYINKY